MDTHKKSLSFDFLFFDGFSLFIVCLSSFGNSTYLHSILSIFSSLFFFFFLVTFDPMSHAHILIKNLLTMILQNLNISCVRPIDI